MFAACISCQLVKCYRRKFTWILTVHQFIHTGLIGSFLLSGDGRKKSTHSKIFVASKKWEFLSHYIEAPWPINIQTELLNICHGAWGLCFEQNNRIDSTSAAAAAKSLQSCLTLCDLIDGSPPGSSIPGILQARTLEWVAISFSNTWKWKWSCSVVSDSLWSHGLQPTRLLCPWDFPGKSTVSIFV